MKKLFTLALSLTVMAMAFAADFTATQSGNWTDPATWGGAGVPGATDNVNTAGFEIIISADAACANLTYANSSAQLAIGDGVTLTVNGVVNSSEALTNCNNPFSTMHANGIVKLTGAALGTSDVNLIMDQAVNSTTANSICTKINNLIIAGADPAKTYKFGQTNRNYIHGTGYFKIMGGTKIDLENIMQLGSAVDNSFIVEEGATVLAKQNVKGGGGNATKITAVTINGTITCNSGLNATTIAIGNNGYFKTLRNKAANDDATLAGWWAAIGTPGTTLTNYGIPETITIGSNATVEFAGGASQSIQGIIPGTTNTIPYANVLISTTAAKTIQSNMVINGNLSVPDGGFTIPAGKIVLITNGTTTGNAPTVNGYLINATASDNTMGTIEGTLTGADVSLVAKAKSGYKFVSWTEEPTGEISAEATLPTFTASASRTLVANFSLSTGLNNAENDNLFSVNGNVINISKSVASVEVYSLQGSHIKSLNNVTSFTFENQGVYILKMNTISGIKTQKVIIK
jgi:hypothetical protein